MQSLLRRYQEFSRRWRVFIGITLFCLVNGLIVYYLLRDWRALSLADLQLNAWPLAVCFVVQTAGMWLVMYVWILMLRQIGYTLPWRKHIKYYTLSNLASFIPGFVWGIFGRAYLYERSGGTKLDISIASVLEIMIFGIAGTLVALIALALPGSAIIGFSPVVLVLVVALCSLLAHPHIAAYATRYLQARYPERRIDLHWYHLPLWSMLDAIATALGAITLYFFCQALYPGDNGTLVPIIQGWSLTIASGSLLFWLPVGSGITSGALVLMLSTAMPLPHALVIVTAWRIWNSAVNIAYGLLGLAL